MVKFFETHKDWTDKRFQIWIGKVVNSHLVIKMYRAGYPSEEIARVGEIPMNVVDKYIKKYLERKEIKR